MYTEQNQLAILNDLADSLFDSQLKNWPDFRERVEQLEDLERKTFKFESHEVIVQFNKARAVSTLAKVDSVSISQRKCFLCSENRPSVQQGINVLGKFELLVNPFPILNGHFTIANVKHTKQEIMPYFKDLLEISKALHSYVIFYNGPKCGASAPDHMHF